VQNKLGLSPGEVTAALAGEFEFASASEIKETLREFQNFLINFEVGLFFIDSYTPYLNEFCFYIGTIISYWLRLLVIILDESCLQLIYPSAGPKLW
jgi:RecQ-mediated genome instability protein 1